MHCPHCGWSFSSDAEAVRFGEFTIDPAKGILARDNVEVRVSATVWTALAYLVRHRARVVTWREIGAEVWAGDADPQKVRNLINRIRRGDRDQWRDLGLAPFIQTYPGRGYRFLVDGSAAPT